MFLAGQTFHGFGATPLFSLGTAYLDENVPQKSSPVYLGTLQLLFRLLRTPFSFLAIHSLLTSIGPIFGLFVGGMLLTIYEDFERADLGK